MQSDASQLTAFVIPMIILLFKKASNKLFGFSIAVVLLLVVAYSWINLDHSPPVSYVEKIMSMVASMGFIWAVLGVASLVILPLPFIVFPPEKSKLLSICIGIYYIMVLVSTQFGNFPVLLMGYGISPIIGYFISITWLMKSRINA